MVVVAVGLNPPASSELVAATWSAMPSLKLVTNLICALLASGAFCRVQNAPIVCRGVSLEDHNQAQYRNSNLGDGGGKKRAKSGADADNVDSDQAKKAEALTQDHQDKLSQGPPPAGNGEQALLRAPSPRPQPQARTISMT